MGRVVAEPISSATFLQFGLELEAALAAIEAIAPELLEVTTLSELTGDPDHASFNGHEIFVVHELRTNAGHIDFGETDHRWESGLVGVPSQTYYEVPLGFAPRSDAPHYGIEQQAWEALSGATTVGTVTASGATITALGELPLGEGSVAVFGAILPTPTEAHPHVYGLVSYGVTVAGGEVLHTILEHRRDHTAATSHRLVTTANDPLVVRFG